MKVRKIAFWVLRKYQKLNTWSFFAQCVEFLSTVFISVFYTLKEDSESNITLPLRRRIWLYQRGFIMKADELFQLNQNDPSDYLSHFHRQYLPRRINKDSADVLDNKILFHKILEGEHTNILPERYGFIYNGVVHTIDGSHLDFHKWLTNQDSEFVVRRSIGAQGSEVHIVKIDQDEYYQNGTKRTAKDLSEQFAGQNWIITEVISQAEYAERIFPDSVNTIRILTLLDSETGEPFIVTAVHRFGGVASAPVDNWSEGGACAAIDLETGELSEAATVTNGERLEFRTTHPDTGERIEGINVSKWQSVKETVLELAEELRPCPFIGWDVVVTGENRVCIIEANSHPGNEAIQVHSGLFAHDDRVRQSLLAHR